MNLPFISTVFWDKFGGNSSPLTPGLLPNCKKIGKICISQQTSEVDLGQIHNRGVILAANPRVHQSPRCPRPYHTRKNCSWEGRPLQKITIFCNNSSIYWLCLTIGYPPQNSWSIIMFIHFSLYPWLFVRTVSMAP